MENDEKKTAPTLLGAEMERVKLVNNGEKLAPALAINQQFSAKLVADLIGGSLTGKHFSPHDLGNARVGIGALDHAECIRKRHKPLAVIGHLYGDVRECEQDGVRLRILQCPSWYNGATTVVLAMPADSPEWTLLDQAGLLAGAA